MNYSQLRQASRAPLEPRLPLPGPLAAHLEVTNFCNLACPWCVLGIKDYEPPGGRRILPLETGRDAVESMAGAGLKVLRLYGTGEPLLDPYLITRIKQGVAYGLRVEVTTNGYLLTESMAEQIVESGLPYLRVSIYPTTPPAVFENIRRLQAIRDAKGKTAPFIYAKCFFAKELSKLTGEIGGVADEVACEEHLLHNWGGSSMRFPTKPAEPRRVCPSPFYAVKISANGAVHPCCVLPHPENYEALLMGNIFDTPILDIWNGDTAKAIRRMMLTESRYAHPVCGKCDFVNTMADNLDTTTRPTEEMI